MTEPETRPELQAALVAGAGLLFAGCDDGSDSVFPISSAIAPGYSGTVPSQPCATNFLAMAPRLW